MGKNSFVAEVTFNISVIKNIISNINLQLSIFSGEPAALSLICKQN